MPRLIYSFSIYLLVLDSGPSVGTCDSLSFVIHHPMQRQHITYLKLAFLLQISLALEICREYKYEEFLSS